MDTAGRELADVRDIRTDTSAPVHERYAQFVRSAGSAYRFRVGSTAVTLKFSGERSLTDALASLLDDITA